jgi:hypothetical protein
LLLQSLLSENAEVVECLVDKYLYDNQLSSYSMSDMTKELGFSNVEEFVTVLHGKGIIHWIKKANCYILSPQYRSIYMTLCSDEECNFLISTWTESGRKFLLDLKKRGQL